MQPLARPATRMVRDRLRILARPAATSPGLLLRPRQTSADATRICLRCALRPFHSSAWRLAANPNPPPPQKPSSQGSPESAAEAPSSAATSPAAESPLSKAPELPSTTESRRSALNKRFSTIMDDLQARVLSASQTLNDITGYTGIEAIKHQNDHLETSLAEAQARVRTCRTAYKTTNARRAATQREVTTLLARKDAWSSADLERFTQLYRDDHALEAEVAASTEMLTDAEAEEQKLAAALSAGILKRYHEEQIWSDRIRRASTWGTWGLMGVNVLLFLVLQFVAEPWKRRRLVKGVVEEEKGVLDEVRNQLEEVRTLVERRFEDEAAAKALREATEATTPLATGALASGAAAGGVPVVVAVPEASWSAAAKDPRKLGAALSDLYSERRVGLRMRDLSLLALESAAAGAAVVGGIAFVFLRRN